MKEEELFGKREAGTAERPPWNPTTMTGCMQAADSQLNTFTLETDVRVRGQMKFLIDIGAELCLCTHDSLRGGPVYKPLKTVNVEGIIQQVEKTLGEIKIK
jgi:hypothetical protein